MKKIINQLYSVSEAIINLSVGRISGWNYSRKHVTIPIYDLEVEIYISADDPQFWQINIGKVEIHNSRMITHSIDWDKKDIESTTNHLKEYIKRLNEFYQSNS